MRARLRGHPHARRRTLAAMTEYPAEADTQPTDPQPDQPADAPTEQPAETGPELPEDQRIPDDEAALLTEDPTAPNPYTDDEDGDA